MCVCVCVCACACVCACVRVCVHAPVYAHDYVCPRSPEESIRAPGLQLKVVVNHHVWGSGLHTDSLVSSRA